MKKNNFFKWIINNYSYIIVSVITVTLLAVVIIVGQDLIIQPHDNLDYNTIYTAFKYEDNYFMNFDGEIPFMGGISRLLMPTNLNVTSIIYYLFSPFTAYMLIFFLKLFIGTASFTLLLRELLDKEKFDKNKNLIVLIGFTFALLPGYPLAYLASASLPLLFYILVRIYKEPKKIVNYVFLMLFPTLSNFIFYGLFIMGYMLVFLIYDLIKNKSKKLLIAYVILVTAYIIVDFRLFYTMFVEGIETIKATVVIGDYDFERIVNEFIEGSYHAGSVHKTFIMPLSAIFIVVYNIINIVKKKSIKGILNIPNLIAVVLLFNGFVMAIYRTELIREFIFSLLPPLEGINLGRTMFFNPILWYLMFFMIVYKINDINKLLAAVIVIIQLLIVIFSSTQYNDISLNINAYTNDYTNIYTYRQYYSEELFDEIKEDIDYDSEYSVAFKMHPSVLVYNKISTLDGYCSYYPLEYKYEFREMALTQLEIYATALYYFDISGSRAYLFSKKYYYKTYHKYDINDLLGDSEEDLFINTEKFKDMGGVYIFSNGKISNADEQGLTFIDRYENEQSLYRIYVYKLE